MSTVRTKTLVLGDSPTLANNLQWKVPGVPDGTLTLEREDGTDVLTVSSSNIITVQGGFRTVQDTIGFRAQSAQKNVNSGLVSYTEFTGWAEEFDTTNAFDTVTGRFQPTVSGFYTVTGAAVYGINGIGNCSVVSAAILKNGIAVDIQATGFTNLVFATIQVLSTIFLNGTTDFLTIGTQHNSGTSPVTQVFARMSAFLLSRS